MSNGEKKNDAKSLRRIALDILFRVEHGLFAENLLAEAFSDEMESRDRAFLQEMVYGTIRRRGLLDTLISKFSSVRINRMETRIILALRLGIYQILHMSRVPSSAAVNETVAIASEERQAKNFCNAVLRAILRAVKFSDKPTEPTRSLETNPNRWACFDRDIFAPLASNPIAHVAAKYSHPEFLVTRWIKRFGLDETIEICRANNRTPQVYVRRNALKISEKAFLAKLRDECPDVRATDVGTYLVAGIKTNNSAMLKAGAMLIQDPTAASVIPFLAPETGERVLDMCAAPGTKAAHLAELMGDRGELIAVDTHHVRIRLLEETRRRLGITCMEIVHADGREYAQQHSESFDKILVDAPCSNTGVLARRVEARWRCGEAEIKKIAALQSELLAAAAVALKPGGTLVYSTCSIEDEENAGVVDEFLKTHDDFALDESRLTLPHRGTGDGGYAARLIRQ